MKLFFSTKTKSILIVLNKIEQKKKYTYVYR